MSKKLESQYIQEIERYFWMHEFLFPEILKDCPTWAMSEDQILRILEESGII